MDSQKNNIIKTNKNNFQYNRQNNYDLERNRNITNRARQLIQNFKKQHNINIPSNNYDNQRILNTDINNINMDMNQLSTSQKKAKEELKTYDYIIRGEGKEVKPSTQNNNLVNEIPVQNMDMVNQENAKLKKQYMNLILENNNLKTKVNFNNSNISKNNLENNINVNNISNNNMPMNDKIFLEESMESMIKSNMRSNPKNDFQKNNKLFYNQRTPNNNIVSSNHPSYNNINNIYNNEQYSNIINDYNQLLREYRNIKFRLDETQYEK